MVAKYKFIEADLDTVPKKLTYGRADTLSPGVFWLTSQILWVFHTFVAK